MARHGYVGEVVVCDNGSTDQSAAVAEAAGARVWCTKVSRAMARR